MRTVSIALLLLWGCGGTRGGGDDDADIDVDTDIDADTDTDADADTDTERPPCPTGDDLVIDNPCDTQDDCAPSRCGIQGGVCVEERWICGDCDYCFFEREPFLDPPSGWECDDPLEHCVPR